MSMLTKNSPKSASGSEEISAFLGRETVFEGKMTFQGVFRLDGKFEGEIFDSGVLVVGEAAVIKGKVEVNTIVIHGLVEGDVFSKARAEIASTGKFHGTLATPVLIINEGGIMDGQCRMEDPRAQTEEGQRPLPQGDRLLST